MDEIQKRKVVQHNDLISSVAKMDKTIWEYAGIHIINRAKIWRVSSLEI